MVLGGALTAGADGVTVVGDHLEDGVRLITGDAQKVLVGVLDNSAGDAGSGTGRVRVAVQYCVGGSNEGLQDGAKIERYVPQTPLSTERIKHKNLLRALGAYRMVLGQPRQQELLQLLGKGAETRNLEWMRLDLGPL